MLENSGPLFGRVLAVERNGMNAVMRRASLWGLPVIVLAGALFLRASGWSFPSLHAALIDLLMRLHPVTGGLRAPVHATEADMAFVTLTGLGLIFLLAREHFKGAIINFSVALTAILAMAWQLYAEQNIAFDPFFIIIALSAVLAAGITAYAADGTGMRGRLKRSLGAHLPPATIVTIANRPEILNLSGETRMMTYMVCNVRGYAELAESFASDPVGLSRLTRRILTPLADAVLERRGAIDRMMPGGLTAFFNAPLDDPEHAIHACEAALRMTEAMDHVNRALENERRADGSPYKPIEIGIGINSGRGVVADFGTLARPEYSVTGRASALTAAIEQASAKYGPAIVTGDATRKLAERNFAFLEVDVVAGGEAGEPISLFALLGNPLVRASPKFRALQTFHDHIFSAYRARDWEKTTALIAQCRQLSGASPLLYDLYTARIAHYEKNPPGEGWNGIVRADLV